MIASPDRIHVFSLLAFGALLFSGCASTGSRIGAECLRNDDCAVGSCVALTCRLPPTDPEAKLAGGENAYVRDTGVPEDAASSPQDAAAPPPDAADPADTAPPDAAEPLEAASPVDAASPADASNPADAATPADGAVRDAADGG